MISVALMLVMISASAYAATVTYSASALVDQGLTGTRTLKGLATSIGSSKRATIVLSHTSSGNTTTYSMSQSVTLTSNITLKIEKGAVLSIAAGKTLTINGTLDAGEYQIFSGAGTVTYTGKKYPEWWGAKDDSGTTDNTSALNSALANGGEIELTAPNGGYYKITDTLTSAVTGTNLYSNNFAEITQATAGKGCISVSASHVKIDGLTLTGAQHAAYNIAETAVYSAGTDSSQITDITINNCIISNWGWEGIRFDYVDRATANHNYLYDIVYSGIQGRWTNYSDFSHNRIENITPGSASGVMVGITLSGTTSQATSPMHGIIADNYIYNTKQAILLEPAQYVTVTGNDLYDNIAGIVVKEHSAGGYSNNVTVTGNTIVNESITAGDTYYGIEVGGNTAARYCVVSGNNIYGYGSSTYGAIHASANTSVNVSNNNIYDYYKYGILTGNSSYSLYSGNNVVSGANTIASSVAIQVGANMTNSAIIGNSGNVGAEKFMSFSASTPSLYIANNRYISSNAVPIGNPTYADFAIYTDTASHTATGITAGTDLSTRVFGEDTIPVGTLIRFTAAGAKSGSAGNKTINIVFGSTSVTAHAAANDTNDWRIQGEIVFAALNTQYVSWTCWNGATISQGYESMSEDISAGDLTLKLRAVVAGASDTVLQRIFVVEKILP